MLIKIVKRTFQVLCKTDIFKDDVLDLKAKGA